MGPNWSPKNGFGTCCGFPVNGFENDGQSNGSSGGSAISPSGWLFNICNETSRCSHQPAFPLALWFIRLWEVCTTTGTVVYVAGSDLHSQTAMHDTQLIGHCPLLHLVAKAERTAAGACMSNCCMAAGPFLCAAVCEPLDRASRECMVRCKRHL